MIIIYFGIFLLIWPIFARADNEDEADTSTDNSKTCPDYRELARLPSLLQLTHRGNKCCENLGCFTNEMNTSWEHLSEKPLCLSIIQPDFYLYSYESSNASSFVKFNYFTLNDTINNGSVIKIRNNQPFFTLIHGFNTKWPCDWMLAIKDELLRLKNNVLLVDWTRGSNVSNYIVAAANTRVVGKAVAKVMQQFANHKYLDLKIATILGFSLGAHTAGYAGSELKELNRIIGLDPAGPLFVCESTSARLDPSDASFVQVLHTNGLIVFKGGLGTMQKLGHVDFYANGGRLQPGCDNASAVIDSLLSYDFAKAASQISCSHTRTPWLFLDILKQEREQTNNSCTFLSFPCEDSFSWANGSCFSCLNGTCPIPGYNLNAGTKLSGRFFFKTLADNDGGTFCGRQFLLLMEANKEVKGSIEISVYGKNNNELFNSVLQESDESMHETKSTTIIAPWKVQLNNITKVRLFYSTSGELEEAITKFTLNNFALADLNGEK